MAKIQEEHIIIKLSSLIKDGAVADSAWSDELSTNLEAIIQEFVGDKVIVEIVKE